MSLETLDLESFLFGNCVFPEITGFSENNNVSSTVEVMPNKTLSDPDQVQKLLQNLKKSIQQCNEYANSIEKLIQPRTITGDSSALQSNNEGLQKERCNDSFKNYCIPAVFEAPMPENKVFKLKQDSELFSTFPDGKLSKYAKKVFFQLLDNFRAICGHDKFTVQSYLEYMRSNDTVLEERYKNPTELSRAIFCGKRLRVSDTVRSCCLPTMLKMYKKMYYPNGTFEFEK